MLLLIPLVNMQNKQIETISSGIEGFSRDRNYIMTTIVYLKNEILLISFPLMSRQLVHCELIKLTIITLPCLMLTRYSDGQIRSTNKLPRIRIFGWFWIATVVWWKMAWFIIVRASECSRKRQEVNLLCAIKSGQKGSDVIRNWWHPLKELKE